MANNKEEPKNAPLPDRWYNLTLGSSFKDDFSNKYCTLRYEFKPASIDKSKPGTLHKNKENRVSVEFQNNQPGKPKVTFEGSSEEYKECDAVLFFDGQSFKLERLHRAVKQLRHLRQPGESAASAVPSSSVAAAPPVDLRSSPVAKVAKTHHGARPSMAHAAPVQVEVERIDIGDPDIQGAKPAGKRVADHTSGPPDSSNVSPDEKTREEDEPTDIMNHHLMDTLFGGETPEKEDSPENKGNAGFDMNIPHQNDTDDEIADVDDSGDEEGRGPNAAEALKAQVNAQERDEQSSSSSSSSSSGSSGSSSGSDSSSSSSDSEASDEDSVNSI
ncbi:Transcription elongation factor Eaf, N-terminal [Dillenia turbinata]|uniref:Transcription elongation factor Eaf, N-terminal n=1 Tax=Dillenia turbinata TaxID=194707 RepID=A0AAN8UUH6_9MAGN